MAYFSKQILRQFLLPSAVFIQAASNKEDSVKKVKPSELPIYPDSSKCQTKPKTSIEPEADGALYKGISSARKEFKGYYDSYSQCKKQVKDSVSEATDQVVGMVSYLQDDKNEDVRLAAVGLGALTGVIFALRGGKIKKLFYMLIGAGTTSAICYPKQSLQVAEEAVEYADQYVNIAYNFIVGVKLEDYFPSDSNKQNKPQEKK